MTDKSDLEVALSLMAETLGYSLEKQPEPKRNFLYTAPETVFGVTPVTAAAMSPKETWAARTQSRRRHMARPMIPSKRTSELVLNPQAAEGNLSWWSPEVSFKGVMESTVEHLFWQLRALHGRWVTVVKSNHLRNLGRVGFARMVIPFPADDKDTPDHRRGLLYKLRADRTLSAKLMVTFGIKQDQCLGPTGCYAFEQTDSFAYPLSRLRLAKASEVSRTFQTEGRTEELTHIKSHPNYVAPVAGFPDYLQPLIGPCDAPHPDCSNWVMECIELALAHTNVEHECKFTYNN